MIPALAIIAGLLLLGGLVWLIAHAVGRATPQDVDLTQTIIPVQMVDPKLQWIMSYDELTRHWIYSDGRGTVKVRISNEVKPADLAVACKHFTENVKR